MSVSRHLQRLRGYVPYIIAFIIALNGFLNLVTGLSDIFQFQFYLNLDSVSDLLNVTPEMRFGGAISVILGVTLIALGKGLIDRRRQPWWWTVGVLALLVVYQLYTGMALRSPGISTGLIILLLFFRRDFNQPTTRRVWTYAEIVAGISVIFALAYGIVGSYLLRSEFNTIEGWADAVYFTVVTYSTLGYGDILPRTPNAKLFTITMVVIGLSSFVTALTVLVGPLIEQRMKGVFSAMSKFQKTVNHVVICGCSKVTDSIIDELQEHHIPFLIVEEKDAMALYLKERGLDVVHGDPTEKAILEQANLPNATAVIAATESDATNTLIALTAQALRNENEQHRFRIIIRIEDEENVEKVRHAGADEVISPSTMGGRMMAHRALDLSVEKVS